ncbi:MAG: SIS domain-containing protein [Ginsengibacter sp.]
MKSSVLVKGDGVESETAREITNQPLLWREVFNLVLSKKNEVEDFLMPLLALPNLRIILTGAGSSAFIGEAACGIIQKQTQRITQAIATTDLVTHPSFFFLREVPTLMISFARSGNSPESVASIKLGNRYCNNIHHLIICCNDKGELVASSNTKNAHLFILPASANDKGLAMTGSFSSMLLSVMLLMNLKRITDLIPSFEELVKRGNFMLTRFGNKLGNISQQKYERVIFLGSGSMLGIARECHLKLQELTDGQVICKHDSFLGFRHGPRAVVNDRSLIVYLFSNETNSFYYERDLAESISKSEDGCPCICFGQRIEGLKSSLLEIDFKEPLIKLDIFYPMLGVILGQLLAYYTSINLNLDPDNPSKRGVINRVVQGVKIYSIENFDE